MTDALANLDPRRHQRFRFRTADALLEASRALGVDLPFEADPKALLEPLHAGSIVVPNRIAVHPMEGCDALPDGAPGPLTFERYRRYTSGGAGAIWFEGTAVVREGRANPRQLALLPETAGAFARLVEQTIDTARRTFGARHRPFLILQLTHAGRYSFRGPRDARRVAVVNPLLDAPGTPVHPWSDEELDELADRFVVAAGLAADAGFDAVDIKACHGYLVHELLAAHQRRRSRYGGSFENRSRFLFDAVARGRRRSRLPVAVRFNATDGLTHPHGFGMATDGSSQIDLAEPKKLAVGLAEAGVALLGVTAGIPVRFAQVARPFDRAPGGDRLPPEHPLVHTRRLIDLAAEIQQSVPATPVAGAGYSWLRQFWPSVAAGVLVRRMASVISLGRAANAYPDAAADLLRAGRLDPNKCCVTCSHCTELMRAWAPTGCVVRDHARYQLPPRPSAGRGAR